jgi:ribose transport system substrate-binding protein
VKDNMGKIRVDRRTVLKAGVGLIGGAAASRLLPLGGVAQAADPTATPVAAPAGDFYSTVTITSEGGKVDTSKYARFRIGFSNGFSGNSWRKMMLAALAKEVKRHPEIKEMIIVDGQNDVNKQVGDIESLISQEVDAILCIANSGTAVVPALKKATDMNIVTLPFNLPVDGDQYTAYTGVDPARKGARNAAELSKLMGNKGNSYTAAGWGAAEPIFKQNGIEVLTFKDTDWQEDKAKVVMSDLIAAYPEIDGVWSDGSQVATGALKALLAANKPLIPVCGDDYNGIFRLYDEYKDKYPNFKFSAISEPTWEVVIALRMALDVLKGGDVPVKAMIEPKAITPETYQQYYRPNLPDAAFVDTDLSDEELKAIFSGG